MALLTFHFQVADAHPTVVKLWASLASRNEKVFATLSKGESFISVVSNGLKCGSHREIVQLLAAAARCAEGDVPFLKSLCTQCLSPILQQGSRDGNPEFVEELLCAASEVPLFLLQDAESVVRYCVATQSLQSMNVLTLLGCENPTGLISVLHGDVIPTSLQLLSSGAEDDFDLEPASLEDDGYVSSDDNYCYAVEVFRQSLQICGRMSLMDKVLPWLESAAASGDAKRSRAVLVVLECVVDSLPSTHQEISHLTLGIALQLCESKIPSLQHSSAVLLGRLSKENGPAEILACLVSLLRSRHTRVLASACRALVSCYQHLDGTPTCTSEVIDAILGGPLQLDVRQEGVIAVQTLATGALAAIARALGTAFNIRYTVTMNALAQLLGHPFLCDAALQSAAIIGQAVGVDVFAADGVVLMRQLLNSELSLEKLVACARLSTALEDKYVPFAQHVVPLLLKYASQEVGIEVGEGRAQDVHALSSYSYDEVSGFESTTVSVPGEGFKKVSINVGQVQDKATATRALYEHAIALGEHFGPFITDCLQTCSNNVTYRYSSEVRSTACQTLAALFEALCLCHEKDGRLVDAFRSFPSIVKAISMQIVQEDHLDIEAVCAMADALSDISYSVFVRIPHHRELILQCYSLEHSHTVVQSCLACLSRSLERRRVTAKRAEHSTTDDERAAILSELKSENGVLTPLVDTIGYNLKFFESSFLPIFDGYVAPVLGPLLFTEVDEAALFAAVCLYDDCVEHCGSSGTKQYAAALLEGITRGMNASKNSEDDDLLRVCIYGLAQIARYSPSTLLGNAQSVRLVHMVVDQVRSEKEDARNVMVYENSISALASLVLFDGAPYPSIPGADFREVWPIFLHSLPLEQDYDEAQICHAGFASLLDSGKIHSDCASRVLRVIGDILALVEEGEEVASQETCRRLSSVVSELHKASPMSMNTALHELSPSSKAALRRVVTP